MAKILIIDNENDLCNVLADILTDAGYSILIAQTEQEAYDKLKRNIVDLVLLDVSLSTGNQEGFAILDHCIKYLPKVPVIIMSAYNQEEYAVMVAQKGAVDFLPKPISREKLIFTVKKELDNAEAKRLKCNNLDIKIVANSSIMKNLLNQIHNAADKQENRFSFVGEKGTGKSTMAYFVHKLTAVKQTRFAVVDCANLTTKQDVSDILVGTVNNGLLFEVFEGTLTLDNAESMNNEVQLAMLAILKQLEQQAQKQQAQKLPLKIISLFDIKIHEMLNKGAFNSELYTKLTSTLLGLPKLSERTEDFEDLIKHYAKNKPIIEEGVLDKFKLRKWVGNLHAFKYEIRNMLLKNPQILEMQNITIEAEGTSVIGQDIIALPYRKAIKAFNTQYFADVLKKTDGNQTFAAHLAQVDRSTVYRKNKIKNKLNKNKV